MSMFVVFVFVVYPSFFIIGITANYENKPLILNNSFNDDTTKSSAALNQTQNPNHYQQTLAMIPTETLKPHRTNQVLSKPYTNNIKLEPDAHQSIENESEQIQQLIREETKRFCAHLSQADTEMKHFNYFDLDLMKEINVSYDLTFKSDIFK